VIKELIENAIDAQARAISIEIRQGGVALMRVSDNGSGMSREDAALAVERFATSKIAAAEDLSAIKTLGFRGEALPSIASVAQLEVLTRTPDELEGTRMSVTRRKAVRDCRCADWHQVPCASCSTTRLPAANS
jgi:DNA mismatch repair protein MutL